MLILFCGMAMKLDSFNFFQVCHQLSEGSKRETNFYELDVQVKGLSNLEDSLVGP